MRELARSHAPGPRTKLRNPHVGPRAFRKDEPFFGRETESSALLNKLIAGRILLLHSPSGAGKTSLLQAALVPAMQARGFQVCATLKPRFSAVRVGLPVPEDLAENRYVYSAVSGVLGDLISDPDQLRQFTLDAAVEHVAREFEAERQLLVIDQFEEILTLDPSDVEGQREFFRQLGRALDNSKVWAVLAIREDFMGGLDRFLPYVPGQLRSTFRLDLLDAEGALRAARKPAQQAGVEFSEDAARELVADLQRIQASGAKGHSSTRPGIYVEPVLLQVVCDRLWRNVSVNFQAGRREITKADVGPLPFNSVLSDYYGKVVKEAAKGDLRAERTIRDWVEEDLLVGKRMRGHTQSKPRMSGADDAIEVMQTRYLIREDPRPGAIWHELSHDRLISPIVEDNARWREENLERWQVAAYRWNRTNARDRVRFLLDATELRAATAQGKALRGLPQFERDFLDASRAELAQKSGVVRAAVMFTLLRTSLALNALLIVGVILLLVFR